METILSQAEAENVLEQLSASEKAEIERDKIRFGEYFIGAVNNNFYRVNPINVIVKNGQPRIINPVSVTITMI